MFETLRRPTDRFGRPNPPCGSNRICGKPSPRTALAIYARACAGRTRPAAVRRLGFGGPKAAAPAATMAAARTMPPRTSVKMWARLCNARTATNKTPVSAGTASAACATRLRPMPRHIAIMPSNVPHAVTWPDGNECVYPQQRPVVQRREGCGRPGHHSLERLLDDHANPDPADDNDSPHRRSCLQGKQCAAEHAGGGEGDRLTDVAEKHPASRLANGGIDAGRTSSRRSRRAQSSTRH